MKEKGRHSLANEIISNRKRFINTIKWRRIRMESIVRKVLDHYFRDVLNRVNDLETAMEVLVNSPLYVHASEVGFNGVQGRKKIFVDLLNEGEIKHIVETGTYLGDTSAYMATTSGVPVSTCEQNKKLYSLAKLRLKDMPLVTLFNLDSRVFLKNLSQDKKFTESECFFYLDAHWGKDLPLKEEISIIASCWDKFIIMIDDFKVPDDNGYIHDSYGTLKYINMPMLKSKYNLSCYFPSKPSTEEIKPPTGCVVLGKEDHYGSRLRRVKSLRFYDG